MSIRKMDLLVQGQEGYQLTWMDAKVDDWVVTPRRGKAVEINALWYNALRLLEGWLQRLRAKTRQTGHCRHAEQARYSFNDGSGTRTAAISMTSSTAKTAATIRPASESVVCDFADHPVLDRERGSR